MQAGHDHNLEHLHYCDSSFYEPNYHIIVSGEAVVFLFSSQLLPTLGMWPEAPCLWVSAWHHPNATCLPASCAAGGGSRRYTKGFGTSNGKPSDYYPTDPSSVWGALTDGFVAVTLKAQEMVVQFYSTDFKNGTTAVHVARIPRLLKPGPDLD